MPQENRMTRLPRFMLRWFEFDTCPFLQRLAFGAILLHPVKDKQTGYRQIAAYF